MTLRGTDQESYHRILSEPNTYEDKKITGKIWVEATHTAGSSRSFTAIRKDTRLYCGSRQRSGEVFAYGGSIQNLKDLEKPTNRRVCEHGPLV